jgi:hypothetical protein
MNASTAKADPGKGSKSAGKDAGHDIRNRTGALNETGPLMDLIQGLNWGGERPSMERLAGDLVSMPLARRQKAVLALQRTRGNGFVQRLAIQAKLKVGPAGDKYEQEADRVADQIMRMTERLNPVQRQEDEEEIQTRPLAASITPLVQRFKSFITSPLQRKPEEEEDIQTKSTVSGGSFEAGSAFESQLSAMHGGGRPLSDSVRGQMGEMQATERILQAKEEAPPNKTGMPDRLKSVLENLSGMNLSGVRVHYNSPKPAQLNALAYSQGQEIHLATGQERHLPHEGWHAVQQMQGRVKPTMQAQGVAINNDKGLEHEAEVMGSKASVISRLSLPSQFSQDGVGTEQVRHQLQSVGGLRQEKLLNFLSTGSSGVPYDQKADSMSHSELSLQRQPAESQEEKRQTKLLVRHYIGYKEMQFKRRSATPATSSAVIQRVVTGNNIRCKVILNKNGIVAEIQEGEHNGVKVKLGRFKNRVSPGDVLFCSIKDDVIIELMNKTFNEEKEQEREKQKKMKFLTNVIRDNDIKIKLTGSRVNSHAKAINPENLILDCLKNAEVIDAKSDSWQIFEEFTAQVQESDVIKYVNHPDNNGKGWSIVGNARLTEDGVFITVWHFGPGG